MTGVDRYMDAGRLLADWSKDHNPNTLAEAQVHATLAVAAATALQAILPLVGGDSEEVTAWAKLLLPGYRDKRYTEAEWRELQAVEMTPEHWPPVHGDVWEDRDGNPWLMESNGMLFRLTPKPADDPPGEILRVYGPLTLRSRNDNNNSCPF